MKKICFVIVATFLIGTSVFALARTVNTCSVSFNFFGLVQVWSGSITTYDDAGNIISTRGCGQSGGTWDWFWE